MVEADFLLRNAAEIVTNDPRYGSPPLGIVRDGALAARNGKVIWVGHTREAEREIAFGPGVRFVDVRGKSVTPGFVDAHTHLVFAGDRSEEYAARLAGQTYQEALALGGGIMSTVRATRAASHADLLEQTRHRADRALAHGTTTLEAKSGYGLTVEDEVKCLRVLAELDARHPLEIVRTFLGAHLVPPEFSDHPGDYIDLVVGRMLPAVVGLAEAADAFCDGGALTVAQSRRVLEAARARGLALRLHANELGPTGGAELAAELRCDSAEHLVYCDEAQARALAAAGTVAVLLPATTFFLGTRRYAPARMMLDAGVTLALGTDCNPGTSYTESMPFVIALACREMGLTPDEALYAATAGGATALGRAGRIGRLAPGFDCDLAVLGEPSPLALAYHAGVNLVDLVVKAGHSVAGAGRAVEF
ncbi:MAG: imidazolonepropionase [Actinomycetota bacterium]